MLSERLRAVAAPLDYAASEHLPVPTDAELAHWLWARLELPGLETRSLGNAGRGVTLDAHHPRRLLAAVSLRRPRTSCQMCRRDILRTDARSWFRR